MRQTETPGTLQATELSPGPYEVRVSDSEMDLQPEEREVELSPGHNSVTVVLGREGQPFFYANGVKVYFEPDERSFLVVARGDRAADILPRLLKRHKLESTPVVRPSQNGGRGEVEGPSDTSFVSVNLGSGQTIERAAETVRQIADELRQQGIRVMTALPLRRGDNPVMGLMNELVVRFSDSITRNEAERIAQQFGLTVERPILYAGNAFLLSRPGGPSYDMLVIAQVLQQQFPVLYAEPNLLQQLEVDQYTPNDTLWANLTHLPLINCDDAWQTLGAIDVNIRGGSADITIAVFDPHGVAPDHPEFTANLTDATSKLVTSFNFNSMSAQTVAALGGDHGTQCAGTATAAFDNNRGIAGVAPNCHLIGARLPSPATGIEMADAFIWAAGFNTGNTDPSFPALPARSASVISNSWGANNVPLTAALRDCFDFLTIYGRGGRGCIVTFSTGNLGYVQFSTMRTYAAYQRTIAVGASINVNPTSPVNSLHPDPNGNTNNINVVVDTRALYSPYGPEMDIVAPSHTAYAAVGGGLIDPTTSCERVGTGSLDGCPGAPVCNDYAASFGGTSHASPTIAGAAALVLSVNPALSWVQVREILRTTAVRIDFTNTNSIGQWVDNDADGVAEFSQWYGYGRVDVNAAVVAARDLISPPDILVRENLADTGAVPSTGWHAHSPDIWVRRSDDPIPVLSYASAPPHQTPRRMQDNYVYCRVKNIGGATSNEVYVRAMITHFPGFEFRYPQEFIPTNRPGDAIPRPLLPGTYLIGEVRIDNLAPGADQIVKMTWPQAMVPPAMVPVGGVNVAWHPCLLLEASPHDGVLPTGVAFDVQRDNNIAQRNISILDPLDPATDLLQAIVAGTSDPSGIRSLVIDCSQLGAKSSVLIHLTDEKLMRRIVDHARKLDNDSRTERSNLEEETSSIQLLSDALIAINVGENRTVRIQAPAGTRLFERQTTSDRPDVKLGEYQGLQVLEIGCTTGLIELPLHLRANQFTPLLVGIPRDGLAEGGELRLSQRRGDGDLSAGYSIIIGSDKE
ncbi:MAG TPA: S8 family serine peptidase [Chloroflexia bacterium]